MSEIELYDENGIPWALSADPRSRWNLPETKDVTVLIDGAVITKVTWACRRAGQILFYADGEPDDAHQVNAGLNDEHPLWWRKGYVEFILADGRRG